MLLRWIRRFIYEKTSWRPSYPSIFYSPTWALIDNANSARKTFEKAMEKHKNLPLIVLPEKEAVFKRQPETTKTLFEDAKYCVFCGGGLEIVVDIKECPYRCCETYSTENDEGLPIIVVKTYIKLEGN